MMAMWRALAVTLALGTVAWFSSHQLIGAARSESPQVRRLQDIDEKVAGAQPQEAASNMTRLELAADFSAQAAGWGSCQEYGCHHHYHKSFLCQCNAKCQSFGNCCKDFELKCLGNRPAAPAPSISGTSPAAPSQEEAAPASSEGRMAESADEGFTLVLNQDFKHALDLDSDPIWTWSDGGLEEGQVRFTKEQIKFEGGKMKIVAQPTPGTATQPCSHAEVATVDPKPLVSGELRTRRNMFRYGRYEVRMKAPEVQPGNPDINGNFIAAMFVYKDARFREWREIDFELTGESPTSITTNVLNADNMKRWKAGIALPQTVSVANSRSDFHTYAFEWLPDRITWLIDGKKVREYTGGSVPVPDKAGKIVMNLWVFREDWATAFGGSQFDNNQYPLVAEYEYVKFYKWNGDTSYPCPGLGTSCLTDNDRYLDGNNPCDGQPMIGTKFGQPACRASCKR